MDLALCITLHHCLLQIFGYLIWFELSFEKFADEFFFGSFWEVWVVFRGFLGDFRGFSRIREKFGKFLGLSKCLVK